MKPDKAATYDCPFKGGKCSNRKCMAWTENALTQEGGCMRMEREYLEMKSLKDYQIEDKESD
jgi:hypothetical protein